jgi:hypothetical protein
VFFRFFWHSWNREFGPASGGGSLVFAVPLII